MKQLSILSGILLLALIFFIPGSSLLAQKASYTVPENDIELDAAISELEKKYRPFLRTLPEKIEYRKRQNLPEVWDFCYEYQDIEKLNRLPYNYVDYSYDIERGVLYARVWDLEKNKQKYIWDEDLAREEVRIPEWRYEYRKHRADGSVWEEDMNPEKMPWNFRSAANVVAWYRTSFEVDPAEENKRIFLCFDGVDWAAEVYLNGELLGKHQVYSEKFRFDVSGKLKEENHLAVRVIDGPAFGQPYAPWSIFPDIRAEEHIYVPDPEKSLKGLRPIGHHSGGGFGIFQPVYLEETGHIELSEVFVRNDLNSGEARIRLELDSRASCNVELDIHIMPENFDGGKKYRLKESISLEEGANKLSFTVPMKGASAWSPDYPALYRCRVLLSDQDGKVDGKDALFGCRSFELVGAKSRKDGLREGQMILNGDALFLRGTNIQGLNVFSYWGQEEKLLRSVLMLKAAHFNIIRSTQHVQFPEVRELLDRLGMMSEQDQAAGSQSDIADYRQERRNLLLSGKVLSRVCYNNPGVVLLSFGNECYYDPTEIIKEVLKEDPQRVLKPISGRNMHNPRPMKDEYPIDPALLNHVVDDYHDYMGWYDGGVRPYWKCPVIHKLDHLLTVGEFGGEGLDAYETMSKHYPDHIKAPPETEDILWAASQVEKKDVRQLAGFYGKTPENLGEYIQASQNYQAELVATQMAAFRIESSYIGGYFQFHFLDAIPAFWPKSIVSFDLKPKKAYFDAAQVNQPVVPLFRIYGDESIAHGCEIWVSNDLAENLGKCEVSWNLSSSGEILLEGSASVSVDESTSVLVKKIDFPEGFSRHTAVQFELGLKDEKGVKISSYKRTVPVLKWPETNPG